MNLDAVVHTPSCDCYTCTMIKGFTACVTANAATKHDQDKLPLNLLPFESLIETSKVLQHGANKYAPSNWRKGIAYSRLIAAALRHIFAFATGEKLDSESNLHHLAHASCCILFLLSYETIGGGTDDRVCHNTVQKDS